MNRLTKTTSVSILALAIALGAAPTVSFANTQIGSVAAVNRDIEGTPPGQGARSLILGDRLIENERLVSSPIGSGQMLFLDQTSLTVSPNSEIVLDKYVYDPATEAGQIGLTVARGVLRMVGGRITKTNDALINAPGATIGIRGGIGLVVVGEDGETQIMHVAGEYTKVTAGGETLTMSRSNGFAKIGEGGKPEYLGVASEEQIAAIYNRMQGGGGGSEEGLDNDDAEESGVAEVNSEEPDAVVDEPISTSGESAADDNTLEVEQLNLVQDTDIQIDVQADDEVEANPFANFIGGILVAGSDPFTDASGAVIQNPAAVNFFFTQENGQLARFSQGSLIATLENGEIVRLPDPQDGFFDINPADTSTAQGQVRGRGFGDSEEGLFLYNIETLDEGNVAAVFGAIEGPDQLRTINANTNQIRATAFNVLPDLGIAESLTTQAFLPEGLGEVFDNGSQAQLFLINPPNSNTFGAGSGPASGRESKWLITQFVIDGEGANQNYLLHVGATQVLNNGDDSPDMSSFGRGSFRLGGQGFANRLQPLVGTTSVPDQPDSISGGTTVFGRNDSYLLLGNESAYHENFNPDLEASASFVQNVGNGTFETYGSLHLAQRAGSQTFALGDRFAFGATPNAFAIETGLTGATTFGANEATFLSFAYASNAAGLRDGLGGQEKMLFRTAAADSGGAAFFDLQNPKGAILLKMDETVGGVSPSVLGANLAFGGGRSAVIDDGRFGFRENNNPQSLQGVLSNDTNVQSINTIGGEKVGRPDNQFGQTAFRGALLSHGLADTGSLFPAGTDVTPEFLTWGWWTGQFRFDNDPGDPQFDNARLQYSLGTFVAGDRTNVLPITGTATYSGAVAVNVLNAAGADFVDGGRFQMTWDFGAGNGNAQFNGLQFGNFTVPVAINSATGVNDYGGNTLVGGSMANVQVDGSFFDGPNANDARATAGSIRIDDSLNNRFATGTYWGER